MISLSSLSQSSIIEIPVKGSNSELEEQASPLPALIEEGPNIIIIAEEARPPCLQELIEQIDRLARFPKVVNPEQLASLPAKLNEALQTEPCFLLEHYQTRLIQLRKMLSQVEKLAYTERLASVINQHIIHAEQAAKSLYRESATPVQDSLWPLYERILRLPTLEPDLFGAAVATLQEKLSYADSTNPLIEQLQNLLPQLLPPAHSLWGQEAPFTSGLEKLEEIKKESLILLYRLKKVPEGYVQTFCAPMESIYETYRSFLEVFTNASEKKKEALCIPKAQLSGVGLGFFSLDQEVARTLLSRDERGKGYKENALGTHAVRREAGVFYKPNPEGRFYIGPEMEFAIYGFYQLLGSAGAAPTALAKIRHVFFEDQPTGYGRTLQAGYGVEGILLQELLGMNEVLPFLERSLGEHSAQEVFKQLLDEEWEQEFLKNHPDLSLDTLSSLSIEESAERLIEAFEALLRPLAPHKRCLEFLELPITNATRRDFYTHIFAHSTERLIGALALLTRYPDLSIASSKGNIRSTSLTVELTDLCYYLKKIKRCFPTLSSQQLLQELPQLTSRFDAADFSTHFVVTLLTNPCDHKTDNLMVTLSRNEQGGVESLSLVGIDNDLAFSPTVDSVRSILYLLKPMEQPFDDTIAHRLFETTAEGLVLDWLVALEEQNQAYNRWQKQGVLTQEDLFEDEEPCLRIPLKIDAQLIPSIYIKARQLIELLRNSPSSTHRELLKTIEPRLAAAYQMALDSSDSAEIAYSQVPRCFSEGEKPPFHELVKQSPGEAALSFLSSLNLNAFPLKQRVSLMGKALQTFPSSGHRIVLPGDPAIPSSRRDLFLMAVKQGHRALVARLLEEEKKSRLGAEEVFLSVIEAKNEEEQTAMLIACSRLDLEMIRLLIHYGADPQVADIGGRGALTLTLQRFANNPAQTAAVIRLLGNRSGILWNIAVGHRGWTPLHHLVEAASRAPEEAEPLIAYLVGKGANPDLVDNRGKTPLDHAIELEEEWLVEQLIRLGAGRTLSVKAACAFFDSRPHLQEVYTLLKRHSLLVRWQLSLEALRAVSPETRVSLEGTQLGTIQLSTHLMKELLDGEGEIRSEISYGRRNVNKISLGDGHTLFFKQYPEMPGVEYAIDSLFELLIGHGTSLTDLAKVRFPNGHSYPVLISQGIEGDNLHDVLSDPVKAKRLEKLDPLHFSELFLASLLVNFEDAKPDNFILEQIPDGSYRLVGIDNDHAFVPPLVKVGGTTVQVKCILYCLEQMKQPIHPCAKERFLSFTPERLLRLWLNRLTEKNHHYCALFSERERAQLFKETQKSPGIVIPIPFRPGAIADIYQKIQRLQIALKETDQLTGMELLRQVIPSLGIRYEEAFHAHRTPLKRFLSLVETQYSTAIAGRLGTLFNSRQTLKSMGIPEKAGWKKAAAQGPTQALQELESLEQEIKATGQQLRQIRDALQAGNPDPFNAIRLNTVKEKVINGIPGVFEGIDFKKMRTKGQPNPEWQNKVLSAILTGHYRSLHLCGCAVLDPAALTQLLRNSPQMLTLELRDCPKVNQDFLTQLSKLSYLTHVRLSELPHLKQIVFFHPTLRRLEIVRCQGLEQLTICDRLRSLSIEACWKLSSIEVKEMPLSQADARLPKNAPDDFVLQRLRLKGCPQLHSWRTLFEEWLNASADNEIDLRNVPVNPNSQKLAKLVAEAVLAHADAKGMLSSLRSLYKGKKLAEPCSLIEYYLAFSNTESPRKFGRPNTDDKLKLLSMCCRDLTRVDLSDFMEITDAGLAALASGCPGLTHVNLSKCKITDAGLASLASGCPNLVGVDLSECNQITDAGLATLVAACPGLTSVNFSGCKEITNASLTSLAACRGLTSLNLSGCKEITDASLASLMACHDLTSLNLSRCDKITDAGLASLASGCPELTYLNLLGNRITDSGLASLASGCPELTQIVLSSSKITDAGLASLASGCPSLTHVNLDYCYEITGVGLSALASGCPGLTHLRVNRITDGGIASLAAVCPGLTSVNLSNSSITDAGLAALASNCPTLTSLNLSWCKEITDVGVAALVSGCPGLTKIDLNGCDKVTNKDLKSLASLFCGLNTESSGNAGLVTIDSFDPTGITDAGLSLLTSACPGLTKVKFFHEVTDASLATFASAFPGLTSVNLKGCRKVTDAGLSALASVCHGLTNVNLRDCVNITDAGLSALASVCHGLTTVNLRGYYRNITDTGLSALVLGCPGLTSVNLYGCRITDAGLTLLTSNCPGLTSLNLVSYYGLKDASLLALASACSSLTKVTLICSDATLVSLASVRPGLTSVNLSHSDKVTDLGLAILALGCSGLTNVNLSSCKEITDAGLAVLVSRCLSLTKVDLQDCDKITNKDWKSLAPSYIDMTMMDSSKTEIIDANLLPLSSGNAGLITIDLSNFTEITDAGLALLSSACPGLTTVKFFREITDMGLTSFASLFPSLTGVDLSSAGKITDSGLEGLAIACPNLTSVDLSGACKITDVGLALLASGCPNLTNLNLSHCKRITDAGLAVLASRCPGLTNVELHNCDKIVNKDLKSLASEKAGMISMDLSDSTGITDAGLSFLASAYPNLTDVKLFTKITDAQLASFASAFPNLTIVNLSHCHWISDAGLAALASACPGLTSVDLSSFWSLWDELRNLNAPKVNKITDAGVALLASGCPGLTSINLSSCSITNAGLAVLALRCPGLTNVNLSDCNKITEAGLAVLASRCPGLANVELHNDYQILNKDWKSLGSENADLITIDLSDFTWIVNAGLSSECPGLTKVELFPEITDAQLASFASAFPGLTSVSLRDCNQLTNASLSALASACPNLTSVNLSYCKQVTDAGLSSLASACFGLTRVDLSHCNITDAGLSALASACPNLTSLDLRDCNHITDAGVSALTSGCPGLTEVTLNFNDARLASLAAACPGMTFVNLDGSRVTDVGLAALALGCPGLTDVNLSHCNITDAGLSALVSRSPGLTNVNLSHCKEITDAGLVTLVSGCPGLTKIDLHGCDKITNKDWRSLASSCPVVAIVDPSKLQITEANLLPLSAGITDAGLALLLSACPGLTKVNFGATTDSELASFVSAFPGLTSVNLSLCKITDAGLSSLGSGCPGLMNVNLSRCDQITDAGLSALASACPGLTSVSLSWCEKITDAGLSALASACPGLTSVDLSYYVKVTNAGLATLALGCPGLTSVNLSHCEKITNAGLLSLASACPGLTTVDLTSVDKMTDAGLLALVAGCPGLTEVTLNFNDAMLLSLAAACPGLTCVDLSHSYRVTDVGLAVLASGCPGLTKVKLPHNDNITDAGLSALASGCPGLTNVNLSFCKKITDAGVASLAAGCPQLIEVNLYGCDKRVNSDWRSLAPSYVSLITMDPSTIDLSDLTTITDAGLALLASACPGLTKAKLFRKITDARLALFASAFPNLTDVNLSWCQKITDAGLSSLASACPGLIRVSLSHCNITDASLSALASACPGLMRVSLSHCDITDAGLSSLASACPGLTSVSLSQCNITDAGLSSLASACSGLTSVNLAYSKITDAGIMSLASGCPDLTNVNLRRCGQVTGAGLLALVAGCPGLTEITLNFSDEILLSLASVSSGLTCVDLSHSDEGTDVGLSALASACPGLTNVNLAGSKGITDAGLATLVSGCPGLTKVDLYHCDKIINKDWKSLASSHSLLES